MVSSGSIVVELLAYNLKIKGLNPAIGNGIEKTSESVKFNLLRFAYQWKHSGRTAC